MAIEPTREFFGEAVGKQARILADFEYRGSVSKEAGSEKRVIPAGCVGTITTDLRTFWRDEPYKGYTVCFDDSEGKPVVWAFLRPDEIEMLS